MVGVAQPASRRRNGGPLPLALVAGHLLLSAASPPSAAQAPRLACEVRLLRAAGSGYRAPGRSTILYGPVSFRVAVAAPDRVTAMTVVDEGQLQLSGKERVLCRSSAAANVCEADLGEDIARHTLRIDTELQDGDEGASRRVSRRFRTLDAHPAGDAAELTLDVVAEHALAAAVPPDEVTRLVRVERRGRKTERAVYRDDLTRDDFRAAAAGLDDVRILSVSRPDPARPKLIPILFNVATYLTSRRSDGPALDWSNRHEGMVRTLVEGLRVAARRGVDVEYVLVAYAATGRTFGPFRLRPGADLDEPERGSNDETLGALERFLAEPPPPDWDTMTNGRFVDDFGGVIQTLNDLYLRSYDGLVQGVWITGGWSNPADPHPRFQREMWPERVEELNLDWSDAEFSGFLERLDAGRSIRNDEVLEFVDLLEDYSPHAHARITTFLHAADPGTTDTLQPHRVDSSPLLNVLLVPSDRATRSDRMQQFLNFAAEYYGGEPFRLGVIREAEREAEEDEDGRERPVGRGVEIESVARVLELTAEQLDHSYVLGVEVPNPRQNGGRHDLRFDVVAPAADGETGRRGEDWEPAYMPYYTSSRSLRSRLPDYLNSPFKDLRLLSAYELRKYWSDDELYAAWTERWGEERDEQVRAVLFESWVSINLKRLQASVSSSPRARDKVWEDVLEKLRRAADSAEQLPDPRLARDAALLAGWYVADRRAAGRR